MNILNGSFHKDLSNQILSTLKFIESINTTTWKTYRDIQYGFEFKYPKEWEDKGRDIKIQNWLSKSPYVSVLSFELVAKNSKSTKAMAQEEVGQNNCPGDRIIREDNLGVLYVLYCSASSESYIYLIKLSSGDWLKLWYHDNFEADWPESQKIAMFDQILSTFKFIEPITYKMDSEGFLAPNEIIDCSEKVNSDPSNTTVLYSNVQKGFSFQVPFNNNWGNNRIKLRPYEELSDHIIFGNLAGGEGCGFKRETFMYFDPVKSADDIINDLKKDPYYQYYISKPTKLNLSGLTAVKYEGPGDMCSPQAVIIIGTKFNYRFTYDCMGDINVLENVAKSAKLIN